MTALCKVCAETIQLALSVATVILITNSAPGWVDQSCQLFMPQLLQQIRELPIFAKPMHAPLSFKITAFRRECRQHRNLISLGDGEAERTASLRMAVPEPGRGGRGAGALPDEGPRRVKSVKLLDLPDCQQLIAQHEMLQSRITDVVAFQGSLDLKARFPPSFGATTSPSRGADAKALSCTLVHYPRQQASVPYSSLGAFGGAFSATAPAGVPARGGADAAVFKSLPAGGGRAAVAAIGQQQQLPPLGAGFSGPAGAAPGGGSGSFSVPYPPSTPELPVGAGAGGLDGGTAASARLAAAAAERATSSSGTSGAPGSGAGEDSEAPKQQSAMKEVLSGPSAGGQAAEPPSPMRPGPPWNKMGDDWGGGGRAPSYFGSPGKKRPVLAAGIGARPSATWRDNSAPVASRNF